MKEKVLIELTPEQVKWLELAIYEGIRKCQIEHHQYTWRDCVSYTCEDGLKKYIQILNEIKRGEEDGFVEKAIANTKTT